MRTSLKLPSSKPQRKAVVRHGGDGVSPHAEGSPAPEGSLKLPQLIFKLHRAPGLGTEQGAGFTPTSEPRIPSTAPLVGLPPPCLSHPHSSSATGEI